MGAAPSHDAPAAPASRAPPRARLGSRPSGDATPAGYELASAAAARAGGSAAAVVIGRGKGPLVGYAAPVQKRAIVTNVVSLQRASVKVVRAPGERGERGVYLVEFLFDAQVPGWVTVYQCAERAVKSGDGAARVEKVSFTCLNRERVSKTRFGVGVRQRYQQKGEKGLDTVRFKEHVVMKEGSERWPIVVRLEACYPEDSTVPLKERVVAQMTMITLTEEGDGYGCAVLRQDVLVDGTLYKLQELYGIAAEVTATKEDATKEKPSGFTLDDKGNECVICLTEACTVVVRPCNHLCLCEECSDRLVSGSNYEKRRCPICRSPLGSLLPIYGGGDKKDEEGGADLGARPVSTPDESGDAEGGTAGADSGSGESEGDVERSGDGAVSLDVGTEGEGRGGVSTTTSTDYGAAAGSAATKGADIAKT